MEEKLDQYLQKMLLPADEWVRDLAAEAKADRVPIMDPVGMNFVMQLIRLTKPQRILEVGTAIGYSAMRMVEANPYASIITIEHDKVRYNQAFNNIHKMEMEHNIEVIHGDASEVIPTLAAEESFDMVFIDAAKGQYKRFFELAAPLLSDNGFILSDNVLFKGYVADEEKEHPRFQKIARKLRDYNDWLIQHPNFITSIVPIGDGVAISYKSNGKELKDYV
ncbi:O-methyltransferase [Virgibacillus ihumii]|uniref:O-methyltransferase n=1 Tax=Virgibacillus ihumii TaxID=2686091 RepID=UPI00157DDCE8|nr:O-methyltransferase [Virgibacillus ihumii]